MKTKHHIKIGDKVKIIAGNQKGFIGLITSFFPKKNCVFIEGIIPRIRIMKRSKEEKQEEKKIPISIHVSNVMLWDIEKNESSRIGYRIIEKEGKKKKVRYFKKSQNIL